MLHGSLWPVVGSCLVLGATNSTIGTPMRPDETDLLLLTGTEGTVAIPSRRKTPRAEPVFYAEEPLDP